MSRATLHSYMEYYGGISLEAALKDTIANAARPSAVSLVRDWGERHLGVNSQSETINIDAATADYLLSGLDRTPQEILNIGIKYAAADDYVPAVRVEPYEEGDYEQLGNAGELTPIYYIRANYLHIAPKPDVAVTAGIIVRYNDLPVLSDSSTDTNCTDGGEQLWALQAMIRYFDTIGENDKSANCRIALYGPDNLNGLLYQIKTLEPLKDMD